MIWFLVTIELLLMAEARSRIRTLSVFDMIGFYIVACQLAFYLAQFVPIVDIAGPGQLRSHLYFNDDGLLLYFWIFLCCYGATLGLSVPDQSRVVDLSGQAIAALERWLGPILLGCAALTLVSMVAVDWGALWYNNRYLLLISRPGLIIDNELTAMVQELSQLLGVVSAFGLAVSLFSDRRALALGFLVCFAWFLLLALAGSGRASAIYLFVIAAVAAVMLQRRRWLVVSAVGGLALLCLLMALGGRMTREYGIAVIADNFSAAMGWAPQRLLFVLGNLTQGIFVTNDGFILDPQHRDSYKLLSFSPLPSAVDGFEQIRRIQEIRLHKFVPMSAITEVIAFGPAYVAMAALSLILGIRLSIVAAQRGYVLLSVLTGTWLFLIFIQAGAYPMRNVFRQELIAILVLAVVLWLRRDNGVSVREKRA